MGSISITEHEEMLASKLSLLEQQMYSECRDLMHALEERKNNEYHNHMIAGGIALLPLLRYTQAMATVRQGVKKLEDVLEEERLQHRSLQAELSREKRELASAKSQLESLNSTHSDSAYQLVQANNALSSMSRELEKERQRSLDLANGARDAMFDALSAEKATISSLSSLPNSSLPNSSLPSSSLPSSSLPSSSFPNSFPQLFSSSSSPPSSWPTLLPSVPNAY
jgi:chromosome segregation ATPase